MLSFWENTPLKKGRRKEERKGRRKGGSEGGEGRGEEGRKDGGQMQAKTLVTPLERMVRANGIFVREIS